MFKESKIKIKYKLSKVFGNFLGDLIGAIIIEFFLFIGLIISFVSFGIPIEWSIMMAIAVYLVVYGVFC